MTDLEGSTAHLRALDDEYASVLAQHHAIIQQALDKEAGVEVGSEGDSFAVLLPGTAGALRAAVAIQRGLHEADWPDSPWRVRIAIHAGSVEMAEAGAVGMSLHEAARIRAVVHGGQIVVSDAARRAIDEPVPAEIALTDLGLHTVRDFNSPVRLHEVAAPGLLAGFPPLKTMAARDVPVPRTPFIGRSAELDAVLDALTEARLVTISGAGGSGKTRLAYEAARRSEAEAISVVELAGLRDATQVDAEVARIVGARDPSGIADAIGAREMLLVFDNCEHVMPRIAFLVSELIEACEGLVVLATSREPLGLAGEVVWQAPQLQPDEARELFMARAAREIDDDELLNSACERLGRMPLAIELAAARVRSVPLKDLVARLDDQLRVLTTGARDVPRQQTLRATLDWSHELLTEDERLVFRQLGVFAGGFTLEAAEAVVSEAGDINVLDAVDGLVVKSLVELSPDSGRYRMLEPVRQYAMEQLRMADESDQAQLRHARWARDFAAEANRNLFTDRQRHWTGVLDAEHDNLGAAIGWCLDHGDESLAAALVSSLGWYWFTSARSDVPVWIPRMLQVDSLDPKDRARVLLAAGITHCDFAASHPSVEWLLEAEMIFRDRRHDQALAPTLFWLGRSFAVRREYQLAEQKFAEAAALYERLDILFGWGWSCSWLGTIARLHGHLDEDERIQNHVLSRCEGVPHVVAAAWGEIGYIADERGDAARADACSCRAIELYRDLGDRWQIAVNIAIRAGFTAATSPETAAACQIESLKGFRELASEADLEQVLPAAAGLLLRAGRIEEAATIAGTVETRLTEDVAGWPVGIRTLYQQARLLLTDPALAMQVERGRRLGTRNASDSAIDWLARAYPASASISV